MSYLPASRPAVRATRVAQRELEGLQVQDRLLALRSLAVLLASQRARTVLAARRAGISWAEIGDRLGMSRQSVWQRYTAEADDAPGPGAQARAFSSCAAYKAVTRPQAHLEGGTGPGPSVADLGPHVR